jgi:hypothetical protein
VISRDALEWPVGEKLQGTSTHEDKDEWGDHVWRILKFETVDIWCLESWDGGSLSHPDFHQAVYERVPSGEVIERLKDKPPYVPPEPPKRDRMGNITGSKPLPSKPRSLHKGPGPRRP